MNNTRITEKYRPLPMNWLKI